MPAFEGSTNVESIDMKSAENDGYCQDDQMETRTSEDNEYTTLEDYLWLLATVLPGILFAHPAPDIAELYVLKKSST